MVKLKQIPEDFVVEEIFRELFFRGGNYSYFWMNKKNISTHDAIEIIARKLGLTARDIGFAGSKDKKAVTSQMISIRGKFSKDISGKNLECKFKGFLDEPISLGEHEGNCFKITLRDIAPFEADIISKNEERLRYLDNMLPNYFDEQRFSSSNVDIGIFLMKKNYDEVVRLLEAHSHMSEELKKYLLDHPHDYVGALRRIPKRMLMLYVHSVQSHFFNELATATLEDLRGASVPYSRGNFLFPAEQAEQKEITVPGFSVEDDSSVKELLSRHGISEEDFINRSLPQLSAESSKRKLLMKVMDFTISKFEDDELNFGKKKALISFCLPKGSYATIVCKFLTAPYD